MSDQRQDHDAARACTCVRACVCASMVSQVSHTSCKCCCHACTLHVPCNHYISGRHVTYVSRARDAAMQSIVCVPTIVLLKLQAPTCSRRAEVGWGVLLGLPWSSDLTHTHTLTPWPALGLLAIDRLGCTPWSGIHAGNAQQVKTMCCVHPYIVRCERGG